MALMSSHLAIKKERQYEALLLVKDGISWQFHQPKRDKTNLGELTFPSKDKVRFNFKCTGVIDKMTA